MYQTCGRQWDAVAAVYSPSTRGGQAITAQGSVRQCDAALAAACAMCPVQPWRSLHMCSSRYDSTIVLAVPNIRLKHRLTAFQIPIRFHVIGAYARGWIAEMLAVIHRLVNEPVVRQLPVGCPLIRPDRGACTQQTTGVVVNLVRLIRLIRRLGYIIMSDSVMPEQGRVAADDHMRQKLSWYKGQFWTHD